MKNLFLAKYLKTVISCILALIMTVTVFPTKAEAVPPAIVLRLIALASSLSHRSPDVCSQLNKWLDKETSTVFWRNLSSILDKLNNIAKVPGLNRSMVKEYLFNFLFRNLSIDSGISNSIADAISNLL